MGKTTLFLSGVPTEPDVNTLINAYGLTPDPAATIPYADVAALIGVTVESHRFRTVTSAWRKALRPVRLIARDGAFRVATAKDRVGLVDTYSRRATTAVSEALDTAHHTDRSALTPRESQRIDKRTRIFSAMRFAALAEAKKSAVPKLAAVSEEAQAS